MVSTGAKRVASLVESQEDKSPPAKKCARARTVAILIMYSGLRYYGMQRNPLFITIEGELLKALLAAGLISNEQFERPSKINFQRASKTDKGVSALGQLRDFDNVVPALNSSLPDDIRVLDVFRTTRSFHAKGNASHRVYKYIMPSFALAPKDEFIIASTQHEYRITAERVIEVNELLHHYVDLSCVRYILSIECDKPFCHENYEFLAITVMGQSFMLHQIRKMIGLTIAIAVGYLDRSIFDSVFRPHRMDIPKAPGLGLFLHRVDYTSYNKRHCNDAPQKAIDWTRYEEKMELFKDNIIYEAIIKKEIEENSMRSWLEALSSHFSIRNSSIEQSLIAPNPNQDVPENSSGESDVSG